MVGPWGLELLRLFRRTCARRGRTGPATSTVFAQDAANKKNERKNHTLNGAWRHRHTQALAMPPRAIQRVIFPLILFVGRVVGKYRGLSWPGSPESCPGAPLVDANA